MNSPLGVIYTPNITPDLETGIGRYTLAEFDRAVRAGVSPAHHLFPAMPYPSYAKISRHDIAALYAYFLLSVQPVHRANLKNEIPWYLNVRWAMPIWNWLFVDYKEFQASPDHNAQWNRGAYLVQGLGHCGACHTPRGLLYDEKALTEQKAAYLSGASLDNWSAVDLRSDNLVGLGRWSEAQLVDFLQTGHNAYGTAFGSMMDAINYSTQLLSVEDNQAIAHYLKSLAPAQSNGQQWHYDPAAANAYKVMLNLTPAASDYLDYCVGCHGRDGSGKAPFMPALAGNPAVLDANAVSLANIVLNGSSPLVIGMQPDFYRMPSFRVLLDDRRVADLLSFIRSSWGNAAPAVSAQMVRDLRLHTDPVQVEQLNLLRMR
jgi:mono/diheme cytochrome c family protein